MKILSQLTANIKKKTIIGNSEVTVSEIIIDSRKVTAGSMFVALKGTQVDGHTFIQKVIEMGATSILCEDLPENQPNNITLRLWDIWQRNSMIILLKNLN
jgi:UDP-N-acetylmuramoyl-L-alanyl-D-glutamate--2,6-diaminopimelate ligase